MILSTRRICLATFLLVGLGVVTAALAWACSPGAGISVTPSTGPPGTAVTISGSAFTADQIRISLGGGPTLATATGPSFTVAATIPANAPAEAHTIVATGPEGTGRATFTVTGRQTAPGTGPGGGSTTPAPTQTGQPDGGGTVEGTANGGDNASNEGRTTGSTSGSTTVQAGNRGRAAANGSVAADGPSTGSSGQAVFRDSLGSSGLSGGQRVSASPDAAPSQRSAAGTLWGGFDSPGPGNLLGADPDGAADGRGSVPTVSVVLLVLGLGTALTGVGIAGVRRRTARARAAG